MTDIFGTLSADPRYVAAFTTALAALWADGTAATLKRYIAGTL